jgi:hypothetical protein
MRRASCRVSFLSTVALLFSASWLAGVPTMASTPSCWGAYGPPQELGVSSLLYGAASSGSTSNAWAVGTFADASSSGNDLVEHWDGAAWTVQPVVASAGSTMSNLYGIGATSASNVWAVGDAYRSGQENAFAVHCC